MVDRFRYLEKFVGTYRVLPHLTLEGRFPKNENGEIDEHYEDLYIPCSKGEIRHTYDLNYELAWMCFERIGTARNINKALKAKYKDLDYKYEEIGDDAMIWFHDADMKKIAQLVKPRTAGAKIEPFSNKNLEGADYKIPKEDELAAKALTAELSSGNRMHLTKQWLKDFDKEIIKIKGKKYKLEEERDNSGLDVKTFIHSIGLWPEYMKFIESNTKKALKELSKKTKPKTTKKTTKKTTVKSKVQKDEKPKRKTKEPIKADLWA